MPVQPGEVQFYLSAPNAGAGYTTTGTPGNSLGKFMSVSQINNSATLDNLFLDITGPENAALQVVYQCVFLMNNTASGLTMYNIFMSFPTPFWTAGGAALSIGKDPNGASTYNSTNPQAVSINSPTQAPAGVTQYYAGPNNLFTSGCPGGLLQPQQVQAFWIQQAAQNTPNLTPQSAQLTATYQTNS